MPSFSDNLGQTVSMGKSEQTRCSMHYIKMFYGNALRGNTPADKGFQATPPKPKDIVDTNPTSS